MSLFQIHKLGIFDFRCFHHEEANFGSGVNLIVGTNGAGKTSLLKAIRLGVSRFFLEEKNVVKFHPRKQDIRRENGLYVSGSMGVMVEDGSISGQHFYWFRELDSPVKSRSKKEKANTVLIKTNLKNPKKAIGSLFEKAKKLPNTKLPLVAYYSAQRLSANRRNKEYDAALGRWNGYYNALFDESNQDYITNWFWTSTVDAASRKEAGIDKPNWPLTNVRRYLKELAIFFGIINENESFDVYYSVQEKSLMVKTDPPNPFFAESPIDEVSDGTKNLFWFVIDLVWRASELNPFLEEHAVSEAEGIVMIDEVEQHLHPAWQAKIVSFLQHIFPKVQFFITTHSPMVISNFKNGNLLLIKDKKVVPQPSFYGRDLNGVVEGLMNISASPMESKELLDNYYSLIGQMKGQTPEALQLRARLEALLQSGAPELMHANALLELYS